MFKYAYNNKFGECSGVCDNQCSIGYEMVVMDAFNSNDILRKVTQVTEDEFGIYTTELLHAINGSKIKVLNTSFAPHTTSFDESNEDNGTN